ncbi:hypothetical protein [Coraliomargarita parva]|uniref:hypothetical protein n=1 Tax=Coraliomargarita parva TaxID=3014050 RepID=UPI0022B59BA8|nr:hypothetical protein [Coraliomargarita parva]
MFYDQPHALSAEGVAYSPIAQVGVPASGDYILLLESDPGQTAIRMALMPDRLAQTEDGWLLINTTAKPIYVRVGATAKPVVLEAHSQILHEVIQTKELELVQFAARLDQDLRIFYSTAWPVYKNSRYLVFFRENAQTGRISVVRIAGGEVRAKTTQEESPE